MDFSTLNLDRLRKLPTCKLPPTYRLQEHSGNGGMGDPPGFPSYFTRSVYTSHGNTPHRGPNTVILFEKKLYVVELAEWKPGETWDTRHARYNERLRSLWAPLPIDHVRTRCWIESAYRHNHSCYIDDSKPAGNNDRLLVYPVPSYKLEHFRDDPRFSDEWRASEKAIVALKNREIEAYAASIAIPENHSAYRRVHEFYPDHTPDLALIANPSKHHPGQWWETEAEQPTPETCKPRSLGPHPINHTWCQWCGWRESEE